MAYAFSKADEAVVPAAPEDVFAVLDDPRRLGRHMEKPSVMMLGGSMHYTLDEQEGRLAKAEANADHWRALAERQQVLLEDKRRKAPRSLQRVLGR